MILGKNYFVLRFGNNFFLVSPFSSALSQRDIHRIREHSLKTFRILVLLLKSPASADSAISSYGAPYEIQTRDRNLEGFCVITTPMARAPNFFSYFTSRKLEELDEPIPRRDHRLPRSYSPSGIASKI